MKIEEKYRYRLLEAIRELHMYCTGQTDGMLPSEAEGLCLFLEDRHANPIYPLNGNSFDYLVWRLLEAVVLEYREDCEPAR